MQKFDVLKIGADLYLVVHVEHLLDLNTVVLLPILPTDALPAPRKPTLDVQIEGNPYRIRAHMPLTVTPVISAVTLWRETPGDALHLSVYCGKFELPADPLLMVEQKGKIEQ